MRTQDPSTKVGVNDAYIRQSPSHLLIEYNTIKKSLTPSQAHP